MNLEQITKLDKKYFMNTFGDRLPVAFDRGEGIKLCTAEGEVYYDFFAGIAVSSIGHSHPALVMSLKKQAEKLLHTSCLYYIEAQALLAQRLAEISFCDRVYFSNSGAEANEGAIKLAKIYHHKKQSGRYEIISLKNSFHGRTLATVAATGQEKYSAPYQPLAPGFLHSQMNDIEDFKKTISNKTAGVIFEFIQGESGVHPLEAEYISEVAKICRENDILLIADEVQTGIGRTGKMFAYQHYGIEPDIMTLAKGLGGGIPIGVVCAKEAACAFSPGEHGGTFGGNPFATNAALTVLDVLQNENLVENAGKMGEYFKSRLLQVPNVLEVRGKGLMLGVGLGVNAKEAAKKLFDRKYLVGSVGEATLRILPPLIITKNDIDLFIETLTEVLEK